MIFTDWIFPVFLAVVFALYWWVKAREMRLIILLAASAIFYGWWDWRFLGLISFVILVSWVAGQKCVNQQLDTHERSRWMWIGVSVNLILLGVFKYFGFFADSFTGVLSAMGLKADAPTLSIILPVGISFYVFQAISYIIDVHRGDLAAETRLRRVALYIAFFPQLVAGPIVRAASFFPQMDKPKVLSRGLMAAGFRAVLIGWVYKAGLADNIAPIIDPVFSDVSAYGNTALAAATFGFAAQIYFDFAGYSLMAIGVARWFGYYIPKNFDFPYASTSIAEFWRRWHMSLSFWLRDYLYISLGGNRKGRARTLFNLCATMVLGGLWHGAAWTFVVWGAMHGAALIVHRLVTGNGRVLIGGAAGWVFGLVLTQAFVVLAWAPFRAESFADAFEIWRAFTGLRDGGSLSLPWFVWLAPLLVVLDAVLGRTELAQWGRREFFRRPLVYWGGLGVVVGLLLALYPLNPAPFVYFQF